MKYIPVNSKFCFIMLCLFFGGMILFSIVEAFPVDPSEWDTQRDPVAFPHEMHMENFDCEDCHHEYDDQKNNGLDLSELYSGNPDIKCSSCHDSDNKIQTWQAFHRLCIGCHNQTAKMNQPTGPTMCNECHRPEAEAPTEYEMIIRGLND